MTKINVDHIYICHWNKLVERKTHTLEQLSKNNITNFSFVELYDIDSWNKQEIQNEYPKVFGKTNRDKRYLKLSEISLLLKHTWAIKDAYDKKYESIMMLEDDVEFCDNFTYYFNNFKKQLPIFWDCCWVGSCCGIHIQNIKKNVNVYPALSSRCTHCYLLNESGINKIVNHLNNIDTGIDWYFNDIIPKLGLNAFWFEPSLAEQSNKFQTTVQN
jgi:GR25 family glycosyltransferase involved in LPS biosynthesis